MCRSISAPYRRSDVDRGMGRQVAVACVINSTLALLAILGTSIGLQSTPRLQGPPSAQSALALAIDQTLRVSSVSVTISSDKSLVPAGRPPTEHDVYRAPNDLEIQTSLVEFDNIRGNSDTTFYRANGSPRGVWCSETGRVRYNDSSLTNNYSFAAITTFAPLLSALQASDVSRVAGSFTFSEILNGYPISGTITTDRGYVVSATESIVFAGPTPITKEYRYTQFNAAPRLILPKALPQASGGACESTPST